MLYILTRQLLPVLAPLAHTNTPDALSQPRRSPVRAFPSPSIKLYYRTQNMLYGPSNSLSGDIAFKTPSVRTAWHSPDALSQPRRSPTEGRSISDDNYYPFSL